MAKNEEMSSFLFRLPLSMKKKLEDKAEHDNKSVNSTLQDIVRSALNEKSLENTLSLEQRNFLGQLVNSNQIDITNGLVQVNGIYYRYLVEGNQEINTQYNYIIIETMGNILTLRPIIK